MSMALDFKEEFRPSRNFSLSPSPRVVPHQCLVSSNVERYFVDLTAKADGAVLRTLEHKTLADSLSELRILDATR
jgi:hypothetical protein